MVGLPTPHYLSTLIRNKQSMTTFGVRPRKIVQFNVKLKSTATSPFPKMSTYKFKKDVLMF